MVPLGDSYDSSTIEPLIGGLRRFAIAIDSPLDFLTIEPLIGGLRRIGELLFNSHNFY